MVGATKDPHRSRGGLRLVLVSRRSQLKLRAVDRIKATDLTANSLERHRALGVTRKEQCIGPSGSDLVFSEQRIAVKGRRARWPSGSRKGVADAAVLGVASSVNCLLVAPFGATSAHPLQCGSRACARSGAEFQVPLSDAKLGDA